MSSNSTAELPDPFIEDPRLRALVRVDPETGCWNWLGDRNAGGYGAIWHEGYYWLAHRYVWALVHGLPDPDLPIDHVCRNRRCVNAVDGHLEVVTTAVNNARIPTWGGNAKTCSKGHEFTPENTLSRADGKRRCRTCHAQQERERRARKAAGDTPVR